MTKTVSSEEEGARLDRCLRLWIPKLPQGLIEKAARKGLLKVNDEKAKPSLRVKEGQAVSFPKSFVNLDLDVPHKKSLALTHADRKWLKDLILFQNADIIVLNKPAGIAVQSGTKQSKSLDAMMKAYDDTLKPRLVHRLDQDTSGILVFALSLPMARWLTKAFKERNVHKTYWAIVCGVPQKKEGLISLSLSKKPEGEKVRVDTEDGLSAITYYRTIESLGNRIAWLELTPKTGRTHQLRVHCAEGLKTPILGDGKYGGKDAFPLGRTPLHLHARALTLPLPTGESITFEAPLSKDIQETFKELGFQDG
ncbi:MAG: RluA family pseudouridine synthase [Proteobacteria bacterium]|nr:RluA family pseudouridine synthase [Pseudomonadota bacterium]